MFDHSRLATEAAITESLREAIVKTVTEELQERGWAVSWRFDDIKGQQVVRMRNERIDRTIEAEVPLDALVGTHEQRRATYRHMAAYMLYLVDKDDQTRKKPEFQPCSLCAHSKKDTTEEPCRSCENGNPAATERHWTPKKQ